MNYFNYRRHSTIATTKGPPSWTCPRGEVRPLWCHVVASSQQILQIFRTSPSYRRVGRADAFHTKELAHRNRPSRLGMMCRRGMKECIYRRALPIHISGQISITVRLNKDIKKLHLLFAVFVGSPDYMQEDQDILLPYRDSASLFSRTSSETSHATYGAIVGFSSHRHPGTID
ncbi:uncharacterized protein LOC143816372 isoform X2 [Ranitomeya variabilis]|uniref:uncharacterized protein LOC143816372 isoform X2 n=1 Tax=Ranitomeya variabilis TaxID=490064 RepID=UPI0040562EDC